MTRGHGRRPLWTGKHPENKEEGFVFGETDTVIECSLWHLQNDPFRTRNLCGISLSRRNALPSLLKVSDFVENKTEAGWLFGPACLTAQLLFNPRLKISVHRATVLHISKFPTLCSPFLNVFLISPGKSKMWPDFFPYGHLLFSLSLDRFPKFIHSFISQ